MKKKIIVITIILAIMTGVFAATAAATLAANPTASTVYVNGTATAFEAYSTKT